LGFADPGLNFPGSGASAVSNDGRVIVGSSQWNAGNGLITSIAVRWKDGRLEQIGASGSGATAVSSDGSVVLLSAATPLVWRSSQPNIFQTLRVPSPIDSASGLSGDGTIVVGTVNVGTGPDAQTRACFWQLFPDGNLFESNMTVPSLDAVAGYGASADGVLLVGEMNTDETGGGSAFVWNRITGALRRLPPSRPGTGATAYAVNESGTMAVGSDGSPLLWNLQNLMNAESPTPEVLDPLGLVAGPAFALNDDGSVVVGGDGSAFVWRRGIGMRLLEDALAEAGIAVQPQWLFLSGAVGVSGNGRIMVGNGVHDGIPQVHEAFVATLGDVLCESP